MKTIGRLVLLALLSRRDRQVISGSAEIWGQPGVSGEKLQDAPITENAVGPTWSRPQG